MNRAVTYMDLGRALRGNETLQVFSSPLLKEVVRKAIGRGGKHSHSQSKTAFSAPSSSSQQGKTSTYPNVQFMSGVQSDEPSFAFLGNLGVPFIHLRVSNSPKVKRNLDALNIMDTSKKKVVFMRKNIPLKRLHHHYHHY